MLEKNLNRSGDVGKFEKPGSFTAQYMKTLNSVATEQVITLDQYQAWLPRAMIDKLRGLTVGDSFCEWFGIQDVYLQLADTNLELLERHVGRYYCPELAKQC